MFDRPQPMHNMKKLHRPTPFLARWKGDRTSDAVYFCHYPSPLAERFLYHVLYIGKARCAPGFRNGHSDENGFLLHYIHEGELWHRLRNKEHRLGKGQACLLDLSEPVDYGNDRARVAVLSWVLFNGKDMPHLFTELRADREPVFVNLESQRLVQIHRELTAVTAGEPPAHEIRASSLLTALLAVLFATRADRGSVVSLVGNTEVLSDAVRKAIDFMVRYHAYHGKNGNQALSLDLISDAIGLSKYHFLRLFRRETGMTPMQYLTRYRIEQASRLLKHSNKAIGQISPMVGIPDQNRFARLFRRYTGTTPRDYRNNASASA